MATITPAQPPVQPGPPGPPVYRLTVDEYERIGDKLDDPRVELIDGYLVKKMPKNPEHIWTTQELFDKFETRLPPGWGRRQEQPVRIPAYDEPEPDIAIVRGSNADYKHRLPEPTDAALVVEVSDSTLGQDRGKKLAAYAQGRIPVYWIVNLVDRQVEVYSNPGPGGYASRQDFKPGQQVPVAIAGQPLAPVPVDDILP